MESVVYRLMTLALLVGRGWVVALVDWVMEGMVEDEGLIVAGLLAMCS